jgi:hypothetical protein
MSQWSKSGYEGPKENGWEEGKGKFRFPNNVVYEGQFNKGEFHGEGTLIYPNGVSTIFTHSITVHRVDMLPNGTVENLSRENTFSMMISNLRTRSGTTAPYRTADSTQNN